MTSPHNVSPAQKSNNIVYFCIFVVILFYLIQVSLTFISKQSLSSACVVIVTIPTKTCSCSYMAPINVKIIATFIGYLNQLAQFTITCTSEKR